MFQKIRDEVGSNGYKFFSSYRANYSIVEIAEHFGKPLVPWENGLVQTLVPHAEADPNTYSGIYVLNRFPFHSDLAHWRMPPRYLLLRCVTGYADVTTLMIDGHDVDCPACTSPALVSGEPVSTPQQRLSDGEIAETQEFLPNRFQCVACGLKISGLSHLAVVSLSVRYKKTQVYDVAEYYAPEDDYSGYEDDNNER